MVRRVLSELVARGHDVTAIAPPAPWSLANLLADHGEVALTPYRSAYPKLAGRSVTLTDDVVPQVDGADLMIVHEWNDHDLVATLGTMRKRGARFTLFFHDTHHRAVSAPEGIAVGHLAQSQASGPVGFYDIDTPVTLAALDRDACDYLSAELIPGYAAYLSFTGGPTLDRLERQYGSPAARPLYCSVDAERYRPLDSPARWDLSYLGTYSPDRQPTLERLLIEPARCAPDRRLVVAGPQYPADIDWPANVERIEHLPPAKHPGFYSASHATLNVTRADMIAVGWPPSVRLFEAAACGTAIISDRLAGLDQLLTPDTEILLADSADDVATMLAEADLDAIGHTGRARILAEHTAAHRAEELKRHLTVAMRLLEPAAILI